MDSVEMKKLVEKEFGKSLPELRKESSSTMDECGCHKEFISDDKRLTVRYVSNPNFCGGREKGFGQGLYVRYEQPGSFSEVKLSD